MAERTKGERWMFEAGPRTGPNARTAAARSAVHELVTSRDNRWLKEFRVALRGGVPASNGAVGVEGVRLVEEALASGCRVEAVLFSEAGERHRERLAPLIAPGEMGFPILRTTDRLFEGIADTEHPQGVAALVVPRKFTLEDVLAGRRQEMPGTETPHGTPNTIRPEPLIVVLAGVQDPGNVGTILRTAAAFGATGVVTAATGQSGTASPFAPKALRASAGAALHMPIVSGMALGILLTQFKLNRIATLATCVEEKPRAVADGSAQTTRIAAAPWEVDWRQPIALLVGNEGAGLPEDVVQAADARVQIPMATRVESLNAAAAAAVVLYEAYRQRRTVTGDS